ncbi:hypothetical protein LTR17_024841 [Elasticomyces elasticus]|nr:hypothetical protein LTR17_024841 [Elasticomyces elasticus]
MAIWIGNWLGRKRAVMLGTSIIGIGAVGQTTSFGLTQFIVTRVITGLGTGINTSIIPTWQSETAKPHHRGRMVMIETSLVVFGVMLANYIDLGCLFLEPSSISCKQPILPLMIVLALPILVIVPFLPESPRWLIIKGKEADALAFFSALWDLSPDNPRIQDEMESIKHARDEASESGFMACFRRNRNRNLHRTVLAYVSMVAQQLTGINIVTYYAATIYQTSIGMSPLVSRIVAAAGATEYFLANCVSILLIERLGRRKLLLIGAFGQAIAMAVLAGLISHLNMATGITAAVYIFLYSSAFALGWGNIPWLFGAELAPLVIRAPSAAIATTGGWLFNFLVVIITPTAFNNIGWKTYIIFAIL